MTDATCAARDCMVLIPYYESPIGLRTAIDSLVDEAGRLIVVVVDDGSRVYPAAGVLSQLRKDIPIEVLRLPQNSGIEHALNHGLRQRAAQFDYVARLDCGDRATPNRFQQQLARLDADPGLYLLGGVTRFTGESGTYMHCPPTNWADVRRAMKVNSVFIHPAVTFRSSVVDIVGYYPTDRPAAEDYAYFWTISERLRSENLDDVVVEAEISSGGISTVKRRQQIRTRVRIMLDHFDWSPLAAWGIVRSAVLYAIPRGMTARLRALLQGRTGQQKRLPE